MESPQADLNAPARKNRTPYTILIVALISVCCCAILIAAGYYYYRQNILTIPVQPTEESTPEATPSSMLPLQRWEKLATAVTCNIKSAPV
ncbi:MAG TPA: hypothetical protein VK909_21890 [Anaerolineales bacterium]|nr:hypothetical protein [Anaerolineales bacterium]